MLKMFLFIYEKTFKNLKVDLELLDQQEINLLFPFGFTV